MEFAPENSTPSLQCAPRDGTIERPNLRRLRRSTSKHFFPSASQSARQPTLQSAHTNPELGDIPLDDEMIDRRASIMLMETHQVPPAPIDGTASRDGFWNGSLRSRLKDFFSGVNIPEPGDWVAILVFGALGTLLRLHLSGVSTKPQVAFGSVSAYWSSNVLGTLIIAFFVGCGNGPNFWSKTLHRGVVVGFCGGLTTFSSLIVEAVRMSKETWASDMVENIVLSSCGALGAYYFGWHLALVVHWTCADKLHDDRNAQKFGRICMISLLVAPVLLFICGIQLACSGQINRVLAGLCGGVGSLLRFAFAVVLNRPGRYFCIGTFLANMVAVLLLCVINEQGDKTWMTVIGSGFCGGLSTLSSLCNDFMVAVFASQEKPSPVGPIMMAYFYISFTMVVGVGIAAMFIYT